MSQRRAVPERRRDSRVSPKGTVVISSGTYIVRGRIANVSVGGLSARTRASVPDRLLGESSKIDLRFDDPNGSWLALEGTIKRIDARSIAVGFELVPTAFGRIIEETTKASYLHDRMLSIVLVDAAPARLEAMAAGFREVGCTVIEATTPLEAIVRLNDARFEPDLVAVADSFPSQVFDELRRYVSTEHPRARLITIGDATSGEQMDWLSSADAQGDLAGRIRRLLGSVIGG